MKLHVDYLIVLSLASVLPIVAQNATGQHTKPDQPPIQVFNAAVQINGPNGAAEGHNAPTALLVRGGQGGAGGVINANSGNGGGIRLRAGDGGPSSQDAGSGGDIALIGGTGGTSSEIPGPGGSIILQPGAGAPFCGIICSNPGNIILAVRGQGRVGVGTSSPSNTLEIVRGGTTLADSWSVRSSRQLKKNIEPLEGALGKVQQLQGVSYERKDNGNREIGVVAEDVARVLPEIVSRDPHTFEVQGVDYARLTALLIEAIKAQETEIQQLRHRLEQLDSRKSPQ
jgi:hypothetical protein